MSDLVPEAENVIDPTNLLDESKRHQLYRFVGFEA
jgi:hypothetical protein